MSIFQTDKGTKVKYGSGDTFDKLTIISYIGKTQWKAGKSYDPVYDCECECGNRINRRQSYLDSKAMDSKGCKQCGTAAMAAGGGSPRMRYNHRKINCREEVVEEILKEVFKFNFTPSFDPDRLVSTNTDIVKMERI